jgi:uncharacterized Zn finger protein (UPF0148 family)
MCFVNKNFSVKIFNFITLKVFLKKYIDKIKNLINYNLFLNIFFGGSRMNKKCQNCGFENDGKDKFCRKCGTKLVVIEQPVEEKAKPVVQDPEESIMSVSKRKHEKIAFSKGESKISNKMVLGIAVIALILSITAISSAFLISPTSLGNAAVGTNELANNSVTGQKVADGTITDADINALGISRIKAKSIAGDQILNNTIALKHLTNDLADSITGAIDIVNDSITSDKIKNGTITTNDLADNSITSAKIKDGEIKSGDIATDAVVSSKIAASAVTSSEIASGAVDTSELANGAVTYEKMNIKIKCGLASNLIHGDTISHNLANIPTSIVVTPIYDPISEGGTVVLHANVYNVTINTFDIALWFEVEGIPPLRLEKVDGDSGDPAESVDVYWIAIYSP